MSNVIFRYDHKEFRYENSDVWAPIEVYYRSAKRKPEKLTHKQERLKEYLVYIHKTYTDEDLNGFCAPRSTDMSYQYGREYQWLLVSMICNDISLIDKYDVQENWFTDKKAIEVFRHCMIDKENGLTHYNKPLWYFPEQYRKDKYFIYERSEDDKWEWWRCLTDWQDDTHKYFNKPSQNKDIVDYATHTVDNLTTMHDYPEAWDPDYYYEPGHSNKVKPEYISCTERFERVLNRYKKYMLIREMFNQGVDVSYFYWHPGFERTKKPDPFDKGQEERIAYKTKCMEITQYRFDTTTLEDMQMYFNMIKS